MACLDHLRLAPSLEDLTVEHLSQVFWARPNVWVRSFDGVGLVSKKSSFAMESQRQLRTTVRRRTLVPNVFGQAERLGLELRPSWLGK